MIISSFLHTFFEGQLLNKEAFVKKKAAEKCEESWKGRSKKKTITSGKVITVFNNTPSVINTGWLNDRYFISLIKFLALVDWMFHNVYNVILHTVLIHDAYPKSSVRRSIRPFPLFKTKQISSEKAMWDCVSGPVDHWWHLSCNYFVIIWTPCLSYERMASNF